MKKLFLVSLIAVLFSSCMSNVPRGHVGIKFKLYGSEKGVQYETVGSGRYMLSVNEKMYLYPTFRQTKVWTNDLKEDSPRKEGFLFTSMRGLELTANISIEYYIKAENAGKIFELYQKGVDEITNKVLRRITREAFNSVGSKMTAEDIYGDGRNEFMEKVNKFVIKEAEKRFINVEKVSLVSSIVPPQSIKKALTEKFEATQRAQKAENELRQTEAEAKKTIAKMKGEAEAIILKAKAEAQANEIVNKSLTTNLIKQKWINRWDGQLPKVSGQTSTFVDFDKL